MEWCTIGMVTNTIIAVYTKSTVELTKLNAKFMSQNP